MKLSKMESAQSKEFEFIESLAKELSSKNLIFPTSMNATMRIRSALNTADISAAQVAQLVGAEPVLSAQLLKLSNSAAIRSGSGMITDLQTAITRLGFSLVRNVAISVGMRQLSQINTKGPVSGKLESLWKHSIAVAATSYVLAKKLTKVNPDEAMLAGLLHDIGKFYLYSRASSYPNLFANEAAMDEIVQQWYAEIGEAILESWEIPEEIVVAIRDHELLSRVHYGPADLSDVILVANCADNHEHPCSPDTFDQNTAPSAFARLKLDMGTCVDVMQESQEDIQALAKTLG